MTKMKKQDKLWIYALLLMGFVLILTNSCEKDDILLNGTEWRWEGEQYSVYQAWTLVFTSSTEYESWWGTPDDYYQDKGTIGTYTLNGTTITIISSTTYSGTGSYTNKESVGIINGNIMTIDGVGYTKIKQKLHKIYLGFRLWEVSLDTITQHFVSLQSAIIEQNEIENN